MNGRAKPSDNELELPAIAQLLSIHMCRESTLTSHVKRSLLCLQGHQMWHHQLVSRAFGCRSSKYKISCLSVWCERACLLLGKKKTCRAPVIDQPGEKNIPRSNMSTQQKVMHPAGINHVTVKRKSDDSECRLGGSKFADFVDPLFLAMLQTKIHSAALCVLATTLLPFSQHCSLTITGVMLTFH